MADDGQHLNQGVLGLQQALEVGSLAITAEVMPPRGGITSAVMAKEPTASACCSPKTHDATGAIINHDPETRARSQALFSQGHAP